MLRVDGEWFTAAVESGPEVVPSALLEVVQSGSSAQQRVAIGGAPYIVVGIPLPSVGSAYFEVAARELDRTLRVLTGSLAAAATLTAVLAAMSGWWMSRRVLLPLRDVSAAAEQLSVGSLDTRLDAAADPDLEPLALSFNRMAGALQERVAREIRFTSDVSHELRTPLTAISSAADLARRTEMPERARLAIDVLGSQVDHFRALVLDLLEISRTTRAMWRSIRTRSTWRRSCANSSRPRHPRAGQCRRDPARDDRRGPPPPRTDHGQSHREREPVCRRSDSASRSAATGPWSGLRSRTPAPACRKTNGEPCSDGSTGEAPKPIPPCRRVRDSVSRLVEQHVRLHGGSIWIEDAVGGGARFVVELPRWRR